MALNALNSSNLEKLALKGLTKPVFGIQYVALPSA